MNTQQIKDNLDPQLLARVARAIWVTSYRETNPQATGPEISAAWQALEDKPLGQARMVIRMLKQAGLDVTIAGDAP
ncbi:MAG: hypothetical protein AAGM84_01700 [Pseudomonadota bacterium]